MRLSSFRGAAVVELRRVGADGREAPGGLLARVEDLGPLAELLAVAAARARAN